MDYRRWSASCPRERRMTARSWVLPLSCERPPLSLNGRQHHMARYRIARELKQEAFDIATALRLPTGLGKVQVEFHYQPAVRRRMDEDNLFATLKPCLDGLVTYGLVPDDDWTHVRTRCVVEEAGDPLCVAYGQARACWLEVHEIVTTPGLGYDQ
jgi:hypothetical protein